MLYLEALKVRGDRFAREVRVSRIFQPSNPAEADWKMALWFPNIQPRWDCKVGRWELLGQRMLWRILKRCADIHNSQLYISMTPERLDYDVKQ